MPEVGWPAPPREAGPWAGGRPVAPPGNTPLPPLPGAGGVVHGTAASNPFTAPGAPPIPASGPLPGAPRMPGLPTVPPGAPGGAPMYGAAWAAPGAPPPGFGGPFPHGAVGPTPGTRRLVDRAPRWVLALAAVVVLGVVAGGVYLVREGGRQYPGEWDPRVASLAAWVAEHRHLDFEHPVTVNFLTAKEYTAASTGGGGETSADQQESLDQAEAELRAFGLISGDIDLGKESDTLSDSGSLAFYSPATEEVYVRGTELTPGVRVTLAHELTHVLQDQHFDLDLDGDRGQVQRALAEGDAGRIEDEYRTKVLTDDEQTEADTQQQGSDEDQEAVESVSPVLTALFAAPYWFGPQLIAYLDQTGGDERIDEALQDPPTSEVLFDPLLYGSDAAKEPADPPKAKAPAGAKVLEEDTVGPTVWYLMISARLDEKAALQAVDGLAADAYVLYRDGEETCVNAVATADTPEDLSQFANALTLWAGQSPGGTATVEQGDGMVRLRSCDPGTDAPAVGSVEVDALALPVVRTQLYNELRKQGATDDQARCFVKRAISELSVDELTGPSSPELQAKITEIATGCR